MNLKSWKNFLESDFFLIGFPHLNTNKTSIFDNMNSMVILIHEILKSNVKKILEEFILGNLSCLIICLFEFLKKIFDQDFTLI